METNPIKLLIYRAIFLTLIIANLIFSIMNPMPTRFKSPFGTILGIVFTFVYTPFTILISLLVLGWLIIKILEFIDRVLKICLPIILPIIFQENLAVRKKRKNLLKYKQILKSILGPQYLTEDGFLKTPEGKAESIQIKDNSPIFINYLLEGNPRTSGAYYKGGLHEKALRYNIEKHKDDINPVEYKVLKRVADELILSEGVKDDIDISNGLNKGVLAHETFHDIQSYLYDYYPEIMTNLFESVEGYKPEVEKWYGDKNNKKWTEPPNYQLNHLFPMYHEDIPYPDISDKPQKAIENDPTWGKTGYEELEPDSTLRDRFPKGFPKPFSEGANYALYKSNFDLGRLETIPVLLSAAAGNNVGAIKILKEIFELSGLNKDFDKTLPRK